MDRLGVDALRALGASLPPAAGHPRRVVLGLLLLAAAMLSLQVAGFHGLRHDDAFITFRYSQNLANGAGPVFNPGERVQGSTSPGQMLLGAALYHVVGEAHLPSVMSAFGCLGWTAQAAAIFSMLARKGDAVTALFVALAVAAGAARSFQFVALETNLVMALVLWAFALAMASRWAAVAVCCALAGLVRPDAYLVALPLGVWCLRERGWRAWPLALLGLAVTAPWWLFAAWYYGSPIPNTAIATFRVVSLARYAHHLFVVPPASVFFPRQPPAILAFGWAVAIAGAVVLIRRDRRFWALAVYALLHAAAYLYLRPYSSRGWHDYPVVIVFTLFALAALAAAVHLAARVLRLPGARRLPVTASALGLVVVLYGLRCYTSAEAYPNAYFLGARDKAYRRVAAYLREHAAPGDVVISGEVGTIAYYSHRPMYDAGGLVTRGGSGHVLGGDRLETDQVPGLRWAVFYPHLLPRTAVRNLSVESGVFRVYLVELGAPPGAPPLAPLRPPQ